MSLCTDNAYDLYDGLKHNFLYNSDINCIHILLNLYDIEDNIRNIFPKYVSIKYLRVHISKVLKKRRGNQLIAMNLVELIHDDINRLELYLYLEAYKQGFFNKKEVDKLEGLTVKYYKIDILYSLKYLFHFETNINEVLKFRHNIYEDLKIDEDNNKKIYESITKYTTNIIKAKVFSLNKYLDKQLTIDYNSNMGNIKEDETLLTKNDLNRIYREVLKIVIKNGIKLYKDAYWNGLNDSVLNRYK